MEFSEWFHVIPSLQNRAYGQTKNKRKNKSTQMCLLGSWKPTPSGRRKELKFQVWHSVQAFRQVWLGLFSTKALQLQTWSFAKHSDAEYWSAPWRLKCGPAAGQSSIPTWAQCSRLIDKKSVCGQVTMDQLSDPKHLPILQIVIFPSAVQSKTKCMVRSCSPFANEETNLRGISQLK